VTELGTDYAPWDEDRARTLADSLKELPGACLPILHALQEEFGYVHADAIPIVALALNLSKAEIVGVVNFYADFRQEPPARHIMKVCLADSCRAMGSQALVARLETDLGVSMGEMTADRSVSLEAVYCLGNCALSPAVMLDGRLLGRMYPERAATLVAGRSA
jgi:formate dehydrogenase subunit gamma